MKLVEGLDEPRPAERPSLKREFLTFVGTAALTAGTLSLAAPVGALNYSSAALAFDSPERSMCYFVQAGYSSPSEINGSYSLDYWGFAVKKQRGSQYGCQGAENNATVNWAQSDQPSFLRTQIRRTSDNYVCEAHDNGMPNGQGWYGFGYAYNPSGSCNVSNWTARAELHSCVTSTCSYGPQQMSFSQGK